MQGASLSAVSVCGLVAGAVIVGCGSDGSSGPATEFTAGDAVTVSEGSPFAECSADANPEATFFPDSEIEPWLVVNPTNRDHMVAAWQQDRYLNGGCRGNVASVSFDGGVNWEHSSLPKLTPCTDGEWERVSDPWLTFAANGDLYSASLTFTITSGDDPFRAGVLVHKSVDGGLTWGDPMTVSETLGPFSDDKEAITADPLDACSVYLIWARIESGAGDTMFSRTTDCGETWSEPTVLYTGNPVGSFAQIVVLPDGTLIAVFVQGGLTLAENEILVMRSSDGGATWPEEPVVAAIQTYSFPVAPDSDDTVRSGKFDIGVDRETGELHLAWQHFIDSVPPVGIAYASSADGGLTWSAPARIDRTPPADSFEREQAFLPSVEVSDDGTVGVTYYSFENDVPGDARSDADVWFIHCHPDFADCNAPDEWSDSKRLTATSFDYQAAPDSNRGYFLGDYVGLAAAGSDFFALPSITTDSDPADVVFVPIRGR